MSVIVPLDVRTRRCLNKYSRRAPGPQIAGPTYFAAKVLSAWATSENRRGRLHELEALQAASAADPMPSSGHLPRLYDHFEITGPHGDHLCFIVAATSISIEEFRRSNVETKFLRLHVVQIIIAQVLDALMRLHAADVIHTGAVVSSMRGE